MIDNDEAEKIRKELKIQMKSLKWKYCPNCLLKNNV